MAKQADETAFAVCEWCNHDLLKEPTSDPIQGSSRRGHFLRLDPTTGKTVLEWRDPRRQEAKAPAKRTFKKLKVQGPTDAERKRAAAEEKNLLERFRIFESDPLIGRGVDKLTRIPYKLVLEQDKSRIQKLLKQSGGETLATNIEFATGVNPAIGVGMALYDDVESDRVIIGCATMLLRQAQIENRLPRGRFELRVVQRSAFRTYEWDPKIVNKDMWEACKKRYEQRRADLAKRLQIGNAAIREINKVLPEIDHLVSPSDAGKDIQKLDDDKAMFAALREDPTIVPRPHQPHHYFRPPLRYELYEYEDAGKVHQQVLLYTIALEITLVLDSPEKQDGDLKETVWSWLEDNWTSQHDRFLKLSENGTKELLTLLEQALHDRPKTDVPLAHGRAKSEEKKRDRDRDGDSRMDLQPSGKSDVKLVDSKEAPYAPLSVWDLPAYYRMRERLPVFLATKLAEDVKTASLSPSGITSLLEMGPYVVGFQNPKTVIPKVARPNHSFSIDNRDDDLHWHELYRAALGMFEINFRRLESERIKKATSKALKEAKEEEKKKKPKSGKDEKHEDEKKQKDEAEDRETVRIQGLKEMEAKLTAWRKHLDWNNLRLPSEFLLFFRTATVAVESKGKDEAKQVMLKDLFMDTWKKQFKPKPKTEADMFPPGTFETKSGGSGSDSDDEEKKKKKKKRNKVDSSDSDNEQPEGSNRNKLWALLASAFVHRTNWTMLLKYEAARFTNDNENKIVADYESRRDELTKDLKKAAQSSGKPLRKKERKAAVIKTVAELIDEQQKITSMATQFGMFEELDGLIDKVEALHDRKREARLKLGLRARTRGLDSKHEEVKIQKTIERCQAELSKPAQATSVDDKGKDKSKDDKGKDKAQDKSKDDDKGKKDDATRRQSLEQKIGRLEQLLPLLQKIKALEAQIAQQETEIIEAGKTMYGDDVEEKFIFGPLWHKRHKLFFKRYKSGGGRTELRFSRAVGEQVAKLNHKVAEGVDKIRRRAAIESRAEQQKTDQKQDEDRAAKLKPKPPGEVKSEPLSLADFQAKMIQEIQDLKSAQELQEKEYKKIRPHGKVPAKGDAKEDKSQPNSSLEEFRARALKAIEDRLSAQKQDEIEAMENGSDPAAAAARKADLADFQAKLLQEIEDRRSQLALHEKDLKALNKARLKRRERIQQAINPLAGQTERIEGGGFVQSIASLSTLYDADASFEQETAAIEAKGGFRGGSVKTLPWYSQLKTRCVNRVSEIGKADLEAWRLETKALVCPDESNPEFIETMNEAKEWWERAASNVIGLLKQGRREYERELRLIKRRTEASAAASASGSGSGSGSGSADDAMAIEGKDKAKDPETRGVKRKMDDKQEVEPQMDVATEQLGRVAWAMEPENIGKSTPPAVVFACRFVKDTLPAVTSAVDAEEIKALPREGVMIHDMTVADADFGIQLKHKDYRRLGVATQILPTALLAWRDLFFPPEKEDDEDKKSKAKRKAPIKIPKMDFYALVTTKGTNNLDTPAFKVFSKINGKSIGLHRDTMVHSGPIGRVGDFQVLFKIVLEQLDVYDKVSEKKEKELAEAQAAAEKQKQQKIDDMMDKIDAEFDLADDDEMKQEEEKGEASDEDEEYFKQRKLELVQQALAEQASAGDEEGANEGDGEEGEESQDESSDDDSDDSTAEMDEDDDVKSSPAKGSASKAASKSKASDSDATDTDSDVEQAKKENKSKASAKSDSDKKGSGSDKEGGGGSDKENAEDKEDGGGSDKEGGGGSDKEDGDDKERGGGSDKEDGDGSPRSGGGSDVEMEKEDD